LAYKPIWYGDVMDALRAEFSADYD